MIFSPLRRGRSGSGERPGLRFHGRATGPAFGHITVMIAGSRARFPGTAPRAALTPGFPQSSRNKAAQFRSAIVV